MCVSEKGEWRNASVVPLYKGKGDKFECSSLWGISLLSVVGKVYGRVLVERIRCGTKSMVGEEERGFRKGKGCINQVIVVGTGGHIAPSGLG